jgi:flagellar biosynthetic protein FlhB
MADDDKPDDSSKTEDPTAKKLEEARKRGQVAQSKDLNTWIMLLAATLLIGTGMPAMFSHLSDFLKVFLEQSYMLPAGGLASVMGASFFKVMGIIAIPFLILMFAAVIGSFTQIGFAISPEVLAPDWSKVSIVKGWGRLFALRSVVEFVKGLLKLGAIAIVGFSLIYPYFQGIEHTVDQPLMTIMEDMMGLTIRMMTGILVVFLAISLVDVIYQRWEFHKQMMMTKQEIKDEYKQTEGDPYVKGRLKQLRMEKARQRMMQAVPKADVIITNPTHYSIALQYDAEKSPAPVVIAKGIDEVALRIREVAKEHNIILYENRPLARSLYDTVEIDQMVPEELFKAVAEVISFVYQKQGKLKSKKT